MLHYFSLKIFFPPFSDLVHQKEFLSFHPELIINIIQCYYVTHTITFFSHKANGCFGLGLIYSFGFGSNLSINIKKLLANITEKTLFDQCHLMYFQRKTEL